MPRTCLNSGWVWSTPAASTLSPPAISEYHDRDQKRLAAATRRSASPPRHATARPMVSRVQIHGCGRNALGPETQGLPGARMKSARTSGARWRRLQGGREDLARRCQPSLSDMRRRHRDLDRAALLKTSQCKPWIGGKGEQKRVRCEGDGEVTNAQGVPAFSTRAAWTRARCV